MTNTPAAPSLTALLQARIAEAERAFVEQMGGATACQLHKDGRVSGSMKYAEGQFVALCDLRCRLNALSPAPDLTCAQEALNQEEARWQAALQHHQGRSALSWTAYCQGGVDALRAFREALTGVRP
ncbi:MAG: hypothetical protein RMM31_10855 [Anaerolineae bacterium]|nr:hypothetical protein [Thermoflexales bacterium]MDW8396728.1 hypothetical protein [Anaerolineae bacterium]